MIFFFGRNIYDLPFFWGNDIRYNFICNLHAYFEDNSHIRLSDATIIPVIGSDWQAKIRAYEVLKFLYSQDKKDKIKFKVRPLVGKPTQEDNNLAGCLDFMRQTLHHFLRMMSSLPENKRVRNNENLVFVLQLHIHLQSVFTN